MKKKKLKQHNKRLADRVRLLEGAVRKYYGAIYDAKDLAGIWGLSKPVYCIGEMLGNEETPTFYKAKELKEIIKGLPLMDCGC